MSNCGHALAVVVAMDSPVMITGDGVCRAGICATILYVMIGEDKLVVGGQAARRR
jgi:hypothetical protein